MLRIVLRTVICACLCCVSAAAVERPTVQHPFLLWTPAQLADLRERLKNDPDAAQQWAMMQSLDGRNAKVGNPAAINLFKYAVLGDAAAGAVEKKALLAFVTANPSANGGGDPNLRNAAWRDDRTIEALRYDILYDLLSPEERASVEAAVRRYVDWCIANPGPWSDAGTTDANAVAISGNAQKTRTGWLPNMQWPTMIGTHVLAVAIQDEQAIRRIAACDGGWCWYFDRYIADGRFYMEEFAKYDSNIGTMLLWCQGLERLGLGDLGWGYTGKGGATMRRFLGSLIDAGLPRIQADSPTGGWQYPVVWMGDAGAKMIAESAPKPADLWFARRMQGANPKMNTSLWWEAGHARFPEAGFDWLLAESRSPGATSYLPSLYFGLRPILAAKTKPPAAPSLVTRERGFALLRSDETPAYWTSPAPAVALQFGMYYVHYVHDCFSILDFVANNRRIYTRVGRSGTGYAGGDAWVDHCRGQPSAVVVDDLQAKPVDGGERGCEHQRIRSQLDGPVRFCAVRANGIYPEVDQERALLLAPEYLIDVSWLVSPRPRVYDWHVLSPGTVTEPADGWTPRAALTDGRIRTQAVDRPPMLAPLARDAGDNDWNAVIRLRGSAGPATAAPVPGVRVSMLGEAGTVVIQGTPPGITAGNPGVKLMATRTASTACFAAVHEPLAAATEPRLRRITRMAQDAGGIAIRLSGDGIDDRIVMRTGDAAMEPAVYVGDGERLLVADHAWIRISPDRVTCWGDIRALDLHVTGSPALVVQGATVPASITNGVMHWQR